MGNACCSQLSDDEIQVEMAPTTVVEEIGPDELDVELQPPPTEKQRKAKEKENAKMRAAAEKDAEKQRKAEAKAAKQNGGSGGAAPPQAKHAFGVDEQKSDNPENHGASFDDSPDEHKHDGGPDSGRGGLKSASTTTGRGRDASDSSDPKTDPTGSADASPREDDKPPPPASSSKQQQQQKSFPAHSAAPPPSLYPSPPAAAATTGLIGGVEYGLEIALLRGRDLVIKDGTTSDPYVTTLIVDRSGTRVAKTKSKVVPKNLNPHWNELYTEWKPSDLASLAAIRFEVWDHDRIGSDDFMGFGVVTLDDIRSKHVEIAGEKGGGGAIDEWKASQQWLSFELELAPQEGKPNSGNTAVSGSIDVKIKLARLGLPPPDEGLISTLKRIPLLSKLTRSELESLSRSLTEKVFRPGYKMMVEGDVGPECFLITRGQARVTKWNPDACCDQELGVLQQGDLFGETALLTDSHAIRNATITVSHGVGPCHCYLLTRAHLKSILGAARLNVKFLARAAITAGPGAPGMAGLRAGGGGMAGGGMGGGGQPQPLMPIAGHRAGVSAGPAGGPAGGMDMVPMLRSASSAPPDATREKSPETHAMLTKVVAESVLFANIDGPQRKLIVDAMWLREVALDEVIIQQGDIGEHWYVIDSGAFDILLNPKPGSGAGNTLTKVGTRERGAGVGELALLYNAPRAATIKASKAGAVWVLDRWTFRNVLTNAAEEKRARFEGFLKGVKAFDVLLDSERGKLAEALDEISFPAGVRIVTQGELGDTFYVIVSGLVSVSKEKEGELVRLKDGDFFGEKAVMKNEPRAATVTTLEPTTCVYLKSDAFKGLLGSMDDLFKMRQQQYNADDAAKAAGEAAAREAEGRNESVSAPAGAPASAAKPAIGKNGKSLTPEKAPPAAAQQKGQGSPENPPLSPAVVGSAGHLLTNIKLADLKVLGTLGKGSFGHVQLVKDKTTGSTYALKIVQKQAVVDLGQQEHILSEKRTMAQLNHPFLVRLFSTFQDEDKLYFLLEASLGGELFTVLRSRTSFSETTARFYAASIVLAFEYMHAKGQTQNQQAQRP